MKKQKNVRKILHFVHTILDFVHNVVKNAFFPKKIQRHPTPALHVGQRAATPVLLIGVVGGDSGRAADEPQSGDNILAYGKAGRAAEAIGNMEHHLHQPCL